MTGRKVERSAKPRCEIEITPEMIEAGVEALYDWDRELLLPSQEVTLVYKAMFSARPCDSDERPSRQR